MELWEVPVKRVKLKRNELFLIGDLHFDTATFRLREFQKVQKLAKNKPVVFMGDLVDFGFFENIYSQLRRAVAMSQLGVEVGLKAWEESFEMKLLRELMSTFKIIAVCQGNHDERVEKRVGIDIFADMIENQLGGAYFKGIGILEIEADRIYRLFLTHGKRGGRRLSAPVNELEDLARIIEGVDVIAIGHHHKSAWLSYPRMYVEDGVVKTRTVELIAVPAFMGYELYAQRRGYNPPETAVFRLRFNNGVKVEKIPLVGD